MMAPRTAVIVLNYNGARLTIRCVESLLVQTSRPAWILIVDNHSTDDSLTRLRDWAAGRDEPELTDVGSGQAVRPAAKPLPLLEISADEPAASSPVRQGSPWLVLITCSQNRGYAAGNNAGLRYALAQGADALWVLNNDTEAHCDALKELTARLFSAPRPGLCGALVLFHWAPYLVECRAGGHTNRWTLLSVIDGKNMTLDEALRSGPEEVERRLNYVYGACVMASREFVETVGLMDERYFLYCEEQDWAFAAGGRFSLSYAPGARVYHKGGSSTGFSTRKVNVRAMLRLARSRMKLCCKYFPWALPVVAGSIFFAALRQCIRRFSGKVPQSTAERLNGAR